jgi:hypothetical protein
MCAGGQPVQRRGYIPQASGGSNMPVALPEPDGERDGIPLWLCPNCDKFKPLEEFGRKKRNDIFQGSKSGSIKVGAIAASKR